jgi:two-component system, response regulator PdtaR
MPPSRILIVEHDPVISHIIEQRLKKMSYEITGNVRNSSDAFRSLGSNPPDVIITDISLLGKSDGIFLAKQIRARSGVPIIFLYQAMEDAVLWSMKETRPDGYILKPFTDVSLKVSIELAINKTELQTVQGQKIPA